MKIFSKISVYFVLIILVLVLIQHSICPVYDYPPESKFTGNKLYNPYTDIAGKKRIKANFHAHTRVWGGLTNGKKNIKEDLVRRYKLLNYDIAGISDYQSINPYQQNDPLYIPTYEHGYGLTKNHQLSIGTNSVLWNDYLFYQTINNKQYILKELKSRSQILTITHPLLRDAYSENDFKRLTDYDYIEILNNGYGKSLNLWDAALSSGHAVFGMGDDDSHSSENPNDMGCCFNIIFTDSMTSSSVIRALKAGSTIAAEQHGETMLIKRQKAIDMPSLMDFSIDSGIIRIKFDKPYKQLNFIGQDGMMKDSKFDSDSGSYTFKPEDTYIREEAEFNDSTKLYFNPVFRYTGEIKHESAEINRNKTWMLRIISGLIFIVIIFLFSLIKNRKRVNAKV